MKHFITFIICCVVIAFLMICKANAQVYVPDCAASNATFCKVPVIKNNVVIGWTEMRRAAGDITFTVVKQIPDTVKADTPINKIYFDDAGITRASVPLNGGNLMPRSNGFSLKQMATDSIIKPVTDTIIQRINTRFYKTRYVVKYDTSDMIATFAAGLMVCFMAILIYVSTGTNDNYKHKHHNH